MSRLPPSLSIVISTVVNVDVVGVVDVEGCSEASQRRHFSARSRCRVLGVPARPSLARSTARRLRRRLTLSTLRPLLDTMCLFNFRGPQMWIMAHATRTSSSAPAPITIQSIKSDRRVPERVGIPCTFSTTFVALSIDKLQKWSGKLMAAHVRWLDDSLRHSCSPGRAHVLRGALINAPQHVV
jgi:hypothetical protein